MPYQTNVRVVTDDDDDTQEQLEYEDLEDFNDLEDFEEDDEDEYENQSVTKNKPLASISLNFPGITLFYGMTETGKSVLMKALLYLYVRQFAQVFVFQGCPTDDWNCLPSKYIFHIDDQTEAKLTTIMDKAEKIKQPLLIIIDDPFNGNTKYHQSKIWNRLSTMSRHALISVWMSIQNPGLVPPVLKGNVSDLFITRLSANHLSKIYEYTTGFNTLKDFSTYVMNNTTAKGKVFYNNVREAYGKIPYYMVDVPYPPNQFKIKYR